MAYKDIRSRRAVLNAMAECRHLGRERFRDFYGFDEAVSYIVRHEGFEYDSKPILAVAHKYQFAESGPLINDFSGGKSHAARHLARLGFSVDGVALPPDDWTLDEVESIVDAYFGMMLAASQGSLVKSARLNDLERRLVRRNQSSISRKCSNISSILEKLGLPWLRGFAPLPNAQILLEAVLIDRIGDQPDVVDRYLEPLIQEEVSLDREVQPPSGVLLQSVARSRRACRIDYAERDERNRKLGKAGEGWATSYFRRLLSEHGRDDLGRRVVWVSQTQGDGLGYDIAAFEPDGTPIFVEVKTTNGSIAAPFYLSAGELDASRVLGSAFRLMRIFNFGGSPQFYVLKGDAGLSCQLIPQSYRAAPASTELCAT